MRSPGWSAVSVMALLAACGETPTPTPAFCQQLLPPFFNATGVPRIAIAGPARRSGQTDVYNQSAPTCRFVNPERTRLTCGAWTPTGTAPSEDRPYFTLEFRRALAGASVGTALRYRTDFDVTLFHFAAMEVPSEAPRLVRASLPMEGELSVRVEREPSGTTPTGVPVDVPVLRFEGSLCGGAVHARFDDLLRHPYQSP